MRLKQLIYKFSYLDNPIEFDFKDIENTGNKVLLSFNDVLTNISIEKTFVNINSSNRNEIKGYSIINKLIEDGAKIFDSDNQEVIVKEIRTPFFQYSDEFLEDEEYQEFLNKLKELSATKADDVEPSSSGDKPPLEEPAPFVHGTKYEKAKDKLLKLKYLVFEEDDKGFFYKENDPDQNKLIIDGVDFIEVVSPEKIEEGKYKFDDIEIILLNSLVTFTKTDIQEETENPS